MEERDAFRERCPEHHPEPRTEPEVTNPTRTRTEPEPNPNQARAPLPLLAQYSATKGYVENFTRSLAVEYAGKGVHF